jgi:NADPH:quinone reductase-like Zn-dependent oxidoreductase
MKAIRLHAHGGPEQLAYEDAPEPSLKNGDALVRVHSCAITPTELTWSATYTTREGADRLPSIPGHELSGVVEAAGANAVDANVGDRVYALIDFWRDGAAAEYVAVPAADLAPKPPSLNDVQAAAVPLAALTAWQALFDHAGLVPGQEILIQGATGGVGSFATQLAHWRGAYVVGTASAANAALACELGADKVIDYNAVRFEDKVREADVVLDTVGGETLERSWSVLRHGGVLVTIAGSAPADKAARYGVRGVDFIVKPSRAQLIEIGRLTEAGKLRPIIEATFPLEEARQAFERGAGGHNRGKIVLQVSGEFAANTGTRVQERAA